MTIREIASALGVSPSSISNVLNNKPGVGDELRKKIQSALKENGYTIRTSVEKHGGSLSYTLLFLYYQSTNYLSYRNNDILLLSLHEIEKYCQKLKHRCIFKQANHQTLPDMLSPENLTGIDGVLLLGTEYYHKAHPAFFTCNRPIVVMDGLFPEEKICTVNLDNETGIFGLIEHLHKKGHSQIGYIKSRIEFGCLRDRTACFYSALNHFSMCLDPANIIEVSADSATIQKEMELYLNQAIQLPTVFFADNDFIAVSCYQIIQQLGYDIPRDISIVGFDDSDICTLLKPHLTSVHADFKGMAKVTVNQLMNMIEDPSLPVTKLTVASTFIERDSVFDLK